MKQKEREPLENRAANPSTQINTQHIKRKNTIRRRKSSLGKKVKHIIDPMF